MKKTTIDCYESSFHQILQLADTNIDISNVRLVHGIPLGQGQIEGLRFGHAWIEIGDLVIDPYVGSVDRSEYYQIGKIEYYRRYTFEEALQRIRSSKHYGPWDRKIRRAVHRAEK